MADRFEARRYQAGDEKRINPLYGTVTGRHRSDNQWRWQWLEAPAGPADVFLIERVDDRGERTLVGHHGVMPLRFTYGSEDLVFGKTENTMVLPEYRTAFVYPRFEKRFLDEYAPRYHALFSTMGPPTAMRLRKVMGYAYPVSWRSYLVGTSGRAELSALSHYARSALERARVTRRNPADRTAEAGPIASANGRSQRMRDAGFLDKMLVANERQALEKIATEARMRRAIQPRRSWEDLEWRFWNNPNKTHFAWVDFRDRTPAGFAVVSVGAREDGFALLDDYVAADADDAVTLLARLLDALGAAGIGCLRVWSTTDSSLAEHNRFFGKRTVVTEKVRDRWTGAEPGPMPRKVTPRGSAAGLSIEPWEITGIVLEGTESG